MVLLTYFSIVMGELVPKRIGQMAPERLACRVSPVLHMLSLAAAPFVKLLSLSTASILRLMRVDTRSQNAVTEESDVFTTRAKVLDTVSPMFKLTIGRDRAANKDLQDGRYYFNADFTVKARVSDTNVDNGRLHLERFTQGAETGVDFSAVTDGEVEKWSKLAFSDVAAGETVSVDLSLIHI